MLGSSGFEGPFGSPNASQTAAETATTDQIIWDQCWHIATSFLALPDRPIDPRQGKNSIQKEWTKPYTADIRRALHHLMPGMLAGRMQQSILPRDDLLAWYFESAVLGHYKKHVLSSLVKVCPKASHVVNIRLISSRFSNSRSLRMPLSMLPSIYTSCSKFTCIQSRNISPMF